MSTEKSDVTETFDEARLAGALTVFATMACGVAIAAALAKGLGSAVGDQFQVKEPGRSAWLKISARY